MTKIKILLGDITTQKVDAIVNAANKSLLGGGGMDGAIHSAAGPHLLAECRSLHGCAAGEAKITKGHNLPAKYIIHTVGPVYGRENGREAELLSNCYKNSLLLAQKYNCRTIAFPSISTGVYGYPKEEAVNVVHATIENFLKNDQSFDEILFITHSQEDLELYNKYFQSPKLFLLTEKK